MLTDTTLEDELHEILLSLYRRTGQATGYYGNYFLRAVREKGGLAVARKLLARKKASTGFDKLVEAGRADLSVEYRVLQERFSPLFSGEELAEAKRRLDALPPEAFPKKVPPLEISPDEIPEDREYLEGTVRRVTVNVYERRASARAACIRRHGHRCTVCNLDFEERYGGIGKGFIHVHHKKPLSRIKEPSGLNVERDLVPVCPNCHAMLHTQDPPLDVEELRAALLGRTE